MKQVYYWENTFLRRLFVVLITTFIAAPLILIQGPIYGILKQTFDCWPIVVNAWKGKK